MMVNSLLFKAKHIVFCFAAVSSLIVNANQWKFSQDSDYAEIAEILRGRNSSCDKLCIGKVLTKCLKAKKLKAEHIESETIKTNSMCTNALSSDTICGRIINVSERICAPLFSSPAICADQLTANNGCITGTLKTNNFEQCAKYRATVVFSQNTPYILDNIVDYDLIIDDPNNNVTLSPFTYTVPVSGYYILTTQIDQFNLQGANPIIGTPIANLTVDVNGNRFRDTFTPYLAFHNGQKITVTTLISLNAGDLVSVRYNVYVMDDVAGFIPYVGTVIIEGNGSEDNATMFKMHYLSSDCTDLPCTPCQSICTPEPCNIPCIEVDCHNMDCCDED